MWQGDAQHDSRRIELLQRMATIGHDQCSCHIWKWLIRMQEAAYAPSFLMLDACQRHWPQIVQQSLSVDISASPLGPPSYEDQWTRFATCSIRIL